MPSWLDHVSYWPAWPGLDAFNSRSFASCDWHVWDLEPGALCSPFLQGFKPLAASLMPAASCSPRPLRSVSHAERQNVDRLVANVAWPLWNGVVVLVCV